VTADPRSILNPGFWAEAYGLPRQPRWLDEYDGRSAGRQLRLLVAPVGHGKSWKAAYYEMLRAVCLDRNVRILVVSKSRDQARNDAQMVKSVIERYGAIRRDFGLEPSDRWGDSEFTVRREAVLKEPTVTAAGLYGQVEGLRLDLIVCDDVIDWENTYSEVERRKVKEWFDNTLQARLEPGGRMLVIGTRWHPEDLYAHIAAKPGWHVEQLQAVLADGSVLWPERWSREALEAKRLDVGETMFQLKYQNNPAVLEGGAFKREWLKYVDKLPHMIRIVVGVDPAATKRELAKKEPDATALVTVGVDETGNVYVMDVQTEYIDANYADLIAGKCRQFPGAEAAVESNNFQALIVRDVQDRYPDLPVWSEEHYARDKVTRILDLQPRFQQGRIHLWQGAQGLGRLTFEYLAFPTGRHDDTMDALELAVKRALEASVVGVVDPGTGSPDPFGGRARDPAGPFGGRW